jgi:hypothetical protein
VGYRPFVAALLGQEASVRLDFWHAAETFVPAALICVLQGEMDNGQ